MRATTKDFVLPASGLSAMVACSIPAYRYAGLSFVDSWLSIWAVFFFIGFTLTVLEAYFYSNKPPFRGWLPFGFALIVTGLMAAVTAWFASADTSSLDVASAVERELSRHSALYWLSRFFSAAGLFTFLYGTIGSATWPFIKNYYQDTSLGLDLRVPDGRTVIGLQMFRGLAVAVVLFPLLISLRATTIIGIAVLSLLLVATMAIGPLTMAPRWPIALRLIHVVEFSLFCVLYAAVAVWLFAPATQR